MKKNPKSRRSTKETPKTGGRSVQTIAERARMSLELLQQIALAGATNEKAQRRFRIAMLMRVSRIETLVQLIHGAQIAQAHDRVDVEQIGKYAEETEEFVFRASDNLGLAMVKFIYGERGEVGPRGGKRRKWSDWEI